MNKLILLLLIVTGAFSNTASATEIFQGDRFTVTVEGEGPALLLIPGLMSDARVWQPLRGELSAHFELHLVNVRGFGETPPPSNRELIEPGWLQAINSELSEYIKGLPNNDIRVVGHSLGGFLAMGLAIDNPQQVTRVLSIDGVPYLAPLFTRDTSTRPQDMRENAQQMLTYYQSLQNESTLAAAVAQGVFVHATSDEHQRMVIDMSAQSDADLVGVAVHDLLQSDLRDRLSELHQPLLVLGATGAMPDNLQEQATALYEQQLESLPTEEKQQILKIHRSSRHFIMYDDPAWLRTQILGHLQ